MLTSKTGEAGSWNFASDDEQNIPDDNGFCALVRSTALFLFKLCLRQKLRAGVAKILSGDEKLFAIFVEKQKSPGCQGTPTCGDEISTEDGWWMAQ